VSYKALLFLKVVSVPCHKDVVDQSCPSWFQVSCRRGWLRAKDNRYKIDRDAKLFSCFLVNSWTQVKSQCFSVKAPITLCKSKVPLIPIHKVSSSNKIFIIP
jgi:hypothetical protein